MILGGYDDEEESYLNYEQVYLASCCERSEWNPAAHGLDRDMFVMSTRAFDMVQQYYAAHEKTPPLPLMLQLFAGFEHVKDVEPAWAAEHIVQAARSRALLNTMSEATESVQAGDVEGAVSTLASVRDKLPADAAEKGTDLDDPSLFEERDYSDHIPVPDKNLQTITHGIAPASYWFIAARLKKGKTFQLMRFAISAMKAGREVVFFSLEMTRDQASERLHALMLGSWYDPSDPQERRAAVSKWLEKYGARLRIIDRTDYPVLTPTMVGPYCKPDRLVIIDYIGLMQPSKTTSKGDADWSVVQANSRELRLLTLSTRTPILTAAQLNREGSKHPTVNNIAESDSIARDADVLLLMDRPEDAPVTKTILALNRFGPSGDVWWTRFDPATLNFNHVVDAEGQRIASSHKNG